MKQEGLFSMFSGWEAPMLQACLQGGMGRVTTWGGESALASIGDFCFLGGVPVPEVVERTDAPILVPCGKGWGEEIRAVLGEGAVPFTRYATRHTLEGFDRCKLFRFTKAVPQGFTIKSIDREIYFTLIEQEWSRDLCGCFADAEKFLDQGLGFVVAYNGLIAAGAASYAACDGAIEIEIDTRPDFRKQGLATACGAKLILECLKRNIYPSWDAHARRSLSLAEKLGYQADRSYTAYWVEGKKREYFLRENEN